MAEKRQNIPEEIQAEEQKKHNLPENEEQLNNIVPEENNNTVEENGESAGCDCTKELTEKAALLAQKEDELTEAKDSLLRMRAEFDNYRKRVNKEKEEWFKYACMGLLEKILPVIDNFDRAIASLDQQNAEIKNIFSGICMIEKQLKDVLQNEGLVPINAVGESFDPLVHEAVLQVPLEEGMTENQVVEELRKGYYFKDKVLRASMVKVAKSN